MKINKENYLGFFLDFHEGRLSESESGDLLAFLELNPELKDEFSSFENITLLPVPASFEEKDRLRKKIITQYNYKTWLLASAEGDLRADQKKELAFFLKKNPLLKKEEDLFFNIKLRANKLEVYFGKEALKHSASKRIPVSFYYAAASLFIVALVLVLSENYRTPEALSTGNVKQGQKKEIHIPQIVQPEPETPVSFSSESINQEYVPSEKKKSVLPLKHPVPEILLSLSEETPLANDSLIIPISAYEIAQSPVIENILSDSIPVVVIVEPENPAAALIQFSPDTGFSDEEKKRFTWLDIATIAVKGFRKLTGKNVELKKEYDEEGNVVAYAFDAGIFEISGTVTKQ